MRIYNAYSLFTIGIPFLLSIIYQIVKSETISQGQINLSKPWHVFQRSIGLQVFSKRVLIFSVGEFSLAENFVKI